MTPQQHATAAQQLLDEAAGMPTIPSTQADRRRRAVIHATLSRAAGTGDAYAAAEEQLAAIAARSDFPAPVRSEYDVALALALLAD